jgi:hypothetical protein
MLYEEQKGYKGVHFSMLAIGFVVANSWTVLKPQNFHKAHVSIPNSCPVGMGERETDRRI